MTAERPLESAPSRIRFERVVVQGVGLLGGSIGLAMRERGLARRVVGLGRSPERLERARALGAIDEGTTDAAEALRGADAFLTCAPPADIADGWAALAPLLAPGCFVTDVGSVKARIVAEGERVLPPSVRFAGSHPMAGSEKSGVDAARADLFEGRACFVAASERSSSEGIALARRFWIALGMRVVLADPARHDRLMASISHLPHLLSAALVESLFHRGDATLLLRAIAGNGLRDMSRLAEGPADVWEQIFAENADALGDSLDALIGRLSEWRELLRASERGASGALRERLAEAGERRRAIFPACPSASSSPLPVTVHTPADTIPASDDRCTRNTSKGTS